VFQEDAHFSYIINIFKVAISLGAYRVFSRLDHQYNAVSIAQLQLLLFAVDWFQQFDNIPQ